MAYFYGQGMPIGTGLLDIVKNAAGGGSGTPTSLLGGAGGASTRPTTRTPGGVDRTRTTPTTPGGTGAGGMNSACRDDCFKKFTGRPVELMKCLQGCTGGDDEGGSECEKGCAAQFPNRKIDPKQNVAYRKCVLNCPGGEKSCMDKCKELDPTGGQTYKDCSAKCVEIGRCKGVKCPPGQHCDPQDGRCIPDIIPPEKCGKGIVKTGAYPNGKAVEGCPCSAAYLINEGDPCNPGYHPVGSGEDARCECDKYTPDDEETLGEYKFPLGLQALLDRLMGRANEYLDRKPGISDAVTRSMFGAGYDKLRGAGAASRNQAINELQSAGMSGTGAGMGDLGNLAWNTERGISDVIRQIMFANEGQKREDLSNYTNMASGLTNQQMTAQQLLEGINSGRRGESQASLALFMQYLAMLMNSWAA